MNEANTTITLCRLSMKTEKKYPNTTKTGLMKQDYLITYMFYNIL